MILHQVGHLVGLAPPHVNDPALCQACQKRMAEHERGWRQRQANKEVDLAEGRAHALEIANANLADAGAKIVNKRTEINPLNEALTRTKGQTADLPDPPTPSDTPPRTPRRKRPQPQSDTSWLPAGYKFLPRGS
jgi:hypothetical protein